MALITLADIPYINFQDRGTDPTSNPATGYAFVFVKNGLLYIETDNGTVTEISGSGGGSLDLLSDVSLSGLETTGSVLAHNGLNFVDVGIGADNEVLIADSNEATGVRWGSPIASDEATEILLWLGIGN